MISVIGPVQSRYTGAVCVIIIVAGAAFSNTPLAGITTMGGRCAHRSGRVMELRLECGDGIRVDAGFRKRVPLGYCSDKKRMFILSSM